jgi:regulation of enolase protein 1 (concanavalin A-like superfamily)
MADSTFGATIYYTTDGSTPTTSSNIYGGPLIINTTTTVKAIAQAAGDNPSAVASATYTLVSNAGAPVSDDFNGTSLNTSLWTFSALAGGSVSVSNGHAYLAVPGGSNHDAVVGGDNSVRILQTISNADFDVAVKFDSAPSQQYQGEGILVQQDSSDYLRLEFSSDGTQTVVSGNNVVAGNQQGIFQTAVNNASSIWLQVQRSGNNWTISYSYDGNTYTTAGSFSATLNVSAIGPYAWNYNVTPSQAPAINAAVDYFHNVSGGGGTNPPVISNIAASPGTNSATITWQTDESSTSVVNWGTTTSYGNTASNSTLVTSHSLTLTNLNCGTTYDYDVSSTNSSGQTSTSGNQTFATSACSSGGPTSDNFDSSVLNSSLWTFVNPAGDAVLTMNGTAATLNIPHGNNHDPWTTGNGAVSLMQKVTNGNFQVQVRFQSDVELANQEEGILVEQDTTHFLRFDILYDGSNVRLFSADISGSNFTIFVNNPINVTQAPIWLQLTRTGNNWVEQWSTDGQNFVTGATFSDTLTVTSLGPYGGTANTNGIGAPAFTAIVDYFFNTTQILANMDGPPPFPAITIDPNPPSTLVEKALADIQGTGHLDAVAGFEAPSNGGIYWYEYPSSGNLTDTWVKHTIVADGQAYEDMQALDVNGDGAADIIASYTPVNGNEEVVWFENPRGSGGDPATETWPMHVIGTGFGEDNLVLGDIDGDGKIDIATGSYIYFQNSPTSWTQVQYNSSTRGAALLDIGSGNASINLVSTAPGTSTENNAVWFENPREHGGNARTDPWIMHVIGPAYPCNSTNCPGGDFNVASFNAGDFNGDGMMDVVMGQSEGPGGGVTPPPGGLVWFEAPADRRNGTWIRHTIDSQFVDAHCVRLVDMDQNGTLDLVTSEQDQSPLRRVSVFYNDGAGNFTQEIVSNAEGHQTTVGDVQGNGAIDIFNSGHGFFGDPHPLQLFLNPVQ